MAKTNVKTKAEPIYTHGGARASQITDKEKLVRAVVSCFLWEGSHYEDGVSHAKRISELVAKVDPAFVASLAVKARNEYNLRHVSLFLTREMVRHQNARPFVADTVEGVVQRADELAELLAMYWSEGRTPIANSLKKGLGRAFGNFNEFQLSKYNSDKDVTLRDVLFLTHPKAKDAEQQAVWDRLAAGKLATADTWETNLSAGENKKDTWERLIRERKLGGMALLRNLRGMENAGVARSLIKEALATGNFSKVLPFRFIAAAKHAPRYEQDLGEAMVRSLQQGPRLKGKTIIAVDRSGSMRGQLSGKSDMCMQEAADALAMIARDVCDEVVVYTTAGSDGRRIHSTTLCPARHGFALRDAMKNTERAIGGGGIFLAQLMDYLKREEKTADRIIVITDEQDCDNKCNPETANAFGGRNYILNVSGYQYGIGYSGGWTHVSGFSDASLKWMMEYENAGF